MLTSIQIFMEITHPIIYLKIYICCEMNSFLGPKTAVCMTKYVIKSSLGIWKWQPWITKFNPERREQKIKD